MLGWLRGRLERRQQTLDAGAVYSSLYFQGGNFGWEISPATLAGSLSVAEGHTALLEYSRRIGRASSLLRSYKRCMTGGVLAGCPEAPEFQEAVTEATAARVADLWREVHPFDLEREILHRLIVDGDVLVMDDGEVVPADAFMAVEAGPEWNRRVTGWRIGQGRTARRQGLRYIGDVEPGETRAEPWQAGALPWCAALTSIRVGAGHGLAVAARWALLMKADSTRQTATFRGVRSGLDDAEAGEAPRIEQQGVGSIPYLRAGESTERPMAGPDATAQAYESILECEAAAALHVPLSELKSDYRSGSFSNLLMGQEDAESEYAARRTWFHRHVRMPVYLEHLSTWIADGRVRGGAEELAALRMPTWPGPRRRAAQPEKRAMALARLIQAGLSPEEAVKKLEGTES